MRKFIYNILLFIALTSLLIAGSVWVYYKKLEDIKLDTKYEILICGDSHTQAAINDSILNKSLNISQSSEHFLYTFNVLNTILSKPNSVKTVICGVSFHSLRKGYDNAIFKASTVSEMYPRYYPILDSDSRSLILKSNFFEFCSNIHNIYKSMLFSIMRNYKKIENYSFCGKYYRSNKNNIADATINNAIKRHYYDSNSKLLKDLSDLQISYLNKIMQLCSEKNIRLIFINTPVHEKYFNKTPKFFVESYYAYMDNVKDKITLLDYYSMSLPDDCYGDGDHLNNSGAKIFTNLLKERIQ